MNTREAWLDAVRTHLDEQLNTLDAETLSRLNRARQAALEAAPQTRRRPWMWLGMGMATAAAMLLAVSIHWNQATQATAPAAQGLSMEEYELLAGGENLELIENLEFYAWLDSQQSALDG